MIFARGALHGGAVGARSQEPGLYSMADVLGLKDISSRLAAFCGLHGALTTLFLARDSRKSPFNSSSLLL